MKSFFGILSFLLAFGATIPYIFDILKGRAKPARSTRILFMLMMVVTLLVQHEAFTSWVLLFTVSEILSQALLFLVSLKHGIGGWGRLDIVCYLIFGVTFITYLTTQNAVLSLSMLMITDFVAFLPTLVKIWRDPSSDTWLFFLVGGVFAGFASFLSRSSNAYVEIAFPLYIVAINACTVLPILLLPRLRSRTTPLKVISS